jgi:hypothetical protein
MRHGRPENPLEALDLARDYLSEADNFVEEATGRLEDIIVDMENCIKADYDKEDLLGSIEDFISDIKHALSYLK